MTELQREKIVLQSGSGRGGPGCECAGQCSRRLLGLEDYRSYACPPTASKQIWSLMVSTNDRHDAWRAELGDAELLLAIGRSKCSGELETRRAFRIADWTVRTALPVAYDELGECCDRLKLDAKQGAALKRVAAELRELAPIVPGAALDALDALDAIDAISALDALDALDAIDAISALDAIDAISALDALAALDAIDAISALAALAALDAIDAPNPVDLIRELVAMVAMGEDLSGQDGPR